jgi:predicted AlkP superfamily phosphohydrolase/phosphomutase
MFVLVALVLPLITSAKKVMILGIDGMDPKLLQKFVDEGRLPNFKALMEEGDFRPLETTTPPQSPVAWSTFITGSDPGVHGIFDFFHVNREDMSPHYSMDILGTEEPGTVDIGSWSFPTSGGDVGLARKGKSFWEILGDEGMRSTIFSMPVNFPPVEAPGKSLSGMGTPDMLGSAGTFSFYTDDRQNWPPTFGSALLYLVEENNHKIEAKLYGPPNSFRRFPTEESLELIQKGRDVEVEYEPPQATQDFVVYLDREAGAAKFEVGDHEFILKEKEWSDWVPVEFEMIPFLITVQSAARFYLKELSPNFELYVSPLQISPEAPAMPISYPDSWSGHLCDELGLFYTQNMPEEYQALQYGLFTGREYWEQLLYAYEERSRALDYLLDNPDEDLLFVYFGTVDMGSHMLWHYMDENHPAHVKDDYLKDGIPMLYEKLDTRLGRVRDAIDKDTTLIVMSDHGFGPFYWQVNLNSWLLQEGYITLKDPNKQPLGLNFPNVDWSQTRAYSVGLNGLYLNVKGREHNGAVEAGAEYNALMDELEAALLSMKDPRNGQTVVSQVVRPSRDFHGPEKDQGPDILVGFNAGYRMSWESPLGEFSDEIFADNKIAWSGDHCVDNRLVPGILVTNQRITSDSPSLADLTVSVLDEYGIAPSKEMIGKDILEPKK